LEAIALLMAAVGGIISLVCFILVLVQMFIAGDILEGIFGLICCQLYVFIWGWWKWDAPMRGNVMIIWTVGIVLSIIGQGMLGPQYYQNY